MEEQESASGIGAPLSSGTFLLVTTDCAPFEADSGTQGVNLTVRAVCTEENGDDHLEEHGRFGRPTFWITKKAAKFFRGYMDAAKVAYTAKGFDPQAAIGTVFVGRIRLERGDDGYDNHDLLHVEPATDEQRKIAAPFVAEWTGQDKPPSDIGSMKKSSTSSSHDEEDDEDTPF